MLDITKPPDNNLAAALDYAQRGWPVFPCHNPVVPRRVGFGCNRMIRCSCGEPDFVAKEGGCKTPGKHPRTQHGVNDATTDEKRIRGWFEYWPDANIGIATGGGLVGVDVDPRHKGD